MTTEKRLRLIGGTGSPYTRKMVALLRYRHIPYSIMWGDPGTAEQRNLPKPKVTLHPTFFFEDDAGELEAVVDSTPIIRRLEGMYEGRLVIPDDPALALVNYLLEDFGDEWCTKYMFHYRWAFDADIDRAGTMLPLTMNQTMDPEAHKQFKQIFSERQVGRLGVVGSNETTRPVIEGSYTRLLELLDAHFMKNRFLLGDRPGSGDYGIYGQFTQLVGFDPTSMALAYEKGPRTVAWVSVMEDLSGLEPGDWADVSALPATLRAILAEVGKVYVPALLANEKALVAGEESWETEIDGRPWTQKTFPYQAKCLGWIQEEYAALSDAHRAKVDAALAGSGCEALLRP